MKRLLLAAALTLMLVPSASQAQFYTYAYRNTPLGQLYTYRQQVGPFVNYAQGFRPYPGMYPYWANPYTGYPYYNLSYNNFPYLGNSIYPVYQQQQPQVVVQQPIIIQQVAPVQPANNGFVGLNLGGNNNALGVGNGFGNNGFGFGNNNNNNIPLMPQKFGGGLAIPPDVKPVAKADPPKAPLPKLGLLPKQVAKAPEPVAPKAEMPRVADKLAGIELARKAVESGRIAFGSGEYGRAMELFRKAADQNPNDPVIYYLLAQTQFTVGKYKEAVASLSAGMTLKGDWSAAKFEPRNLYGNKPELFDDHLNQLRGALVQFADDASLNFLLGHQLWFDGKREEAMPFLMKAKAAPRGASPAELFLIS
jgi:tetratricopeptide (TPR) repeat protein